MASVTSTMKVLMTVGDAAIGLSSSKNFLIGQNTTIPDLAVSTNQPNISVTITLLPPSFGVLHIPEDPLIYSISSSIVKLVGSPEAINTISENITFSKNSANMEFGYIVAVANDGVNSGVYQVSQLIPDPPGSTGSATDSPTGSPTTSEGTEPITAVQSSMDAVELGLIIGASILGGFLIVGIIAGIVYRKRSKSMNNDIPMESQAMVSFKQLKNVKVGNRLGVGNFGEVFRGEWNVSSNLKNIPNRTFRELPLHLKS